MPEKSMSWRSIEFGASAVLAILIGIGSIATGVGTLLLFIGDNRWANKEEFIEMRGEVKYIANIFREHERMVLNKDE